MSGDPPPASGPPGRVVIADRRAPGRAARPVAEGVEHRRDPLTGLPGGGALRDWIAARGDGGGMLIAIAIVALERTNAALGRGAVDMLLRSVAARIAELAAEADSGAIVARVSGAEFYIGLPRLTDHAAAVTLGERIVASATLAARHDQDMLPVPMRAGIAALPAAAGDAASLVRRMSEALALVPPTGVHRIDISLAGAGCAADLPRALATGEIEILFQPQIDIASGRMAGVEALARWRHATLGILGADTLLIAAEQAGLLDAVSADVLDRALAQAVRWPASLASLRLSVNITAADIARPGFVAGVLAAIDRHGFARNRVTLEIVETMMVRDAAAAASALAALRAAGLSVAIDDFGTGYSSLAYLKALPVDYIKLDKALIDDIAASERDLAIVRGVFAIARALGLSVIAEGVETEQQLALLAAEGCQLYQGFLFSEAVDSDGLAALVSASA